MDNEKEAKKPANRRRALLEKLKMWLLRKETWTVVIGVLKVVFWIGKHFDESGK